MKKIVCELCEGTEFTKDGGMFVCNGCGTKYTAEEAKGMMKEVEGGAAPAPVGGAPAANPNQQQIENLLVLATNAFELDNNEETENYCNRILELDVTCYKAWLLKGQAIGWQSQYGNTRVDEGANAMRKAVDYAPEEEKETVAKQAVKVLCRICTALASLAKKNFGNNPTEDNRLKFGEFLELCDNVTDMFCDVSEEVKEYATDEFIEHKRTAADFMNIAGVSAFDMVREKWDAIDYHDDDFRDTYIAWHNEILEIFLDSISWSNSVGEKTEEFITRLENIICACEELMDSKYYFLSDSFKTSRKKIIKDTQDEIKRLENEKNAKENAEKKARIEAYWEAHKDEKEKLESEKKELSEKKTKLDTELADLDNEIKAAESEGKSKVPAETEADKLKEQKRELENRRTKLGLFAGKEKKQIGEEIAAIDGRISALNNKATEEKKAKKAEMDKKIASLKTKKEEKDKEAAKIAKRIVAIDAELTKDPEEK